VTRLLLASASPARRATLLAAGIDPLVRVSGVDEDAVLAAARERFGALDPADAVLVLAQAKAQAVAESLADAEPAEDPDAAGDLLVLGCDSMLELDGEIHGKPADAAQATERWRAMRGRSGVLHTGHWLIDERDPAPAGTGGSRGRAGTGGTLGATSSTVVHFADLSDAEIDAYVATGEPLAVAGAFTVDGRGGAFVTGIEGDHHGVVGVSLPLVRDLLGQVGLTVPDLWSVVG
jgi:septum formation protein